MPGKVALICGEERLTYSGIDEQADQLASEWIDLGIERQDRVIIFMDNAAESVISPFGGTVVLDKSFLYPYKILEKVVEEKVTGFPLVPTVAALLLQMGRHDQDQGREGEPQGN